MFTSHIKFVKISLPWFHWGLSLLGKSSFPSLPPLASVFISCPALALEGTPAVPCASWTFCLSLHLLVPPPALPETAAAFQGLPAQASLLPKGHLWHPGLSRAGSHPHSELAALSRYFYGTRYLGIFKNHLHSLKLFSCTFSSLNCEHLVDTGGIFIFLSLGT